MHNHFAILRKYSQSFKYCNDPINCKISVKMIKTARCCSQNPGVSMQYSVQISLNPLSPILSPLPPPIRLFSLYNNGALLLYPRCHHPRQLFAAEGKRVSTDFARTPFKGTTFHTLARFLSPPFRSRDQPTAPAMTIATNCYAPRLRCECVPEGLCERLRDVFACTCMLCARVCTRMRIHVCISVRGESHRALQQLRQTSN